MSDCVISDIYLNRFTELRNKLKADIKKEPLLYVDSGIEISLLNESNANGLSKLYSEALERGDWFAGEYRRISGFSPSPSFFQSKISSDKLIWFVFSKADEVVGATQLALCKNGSVVIDETQLDPKKGRGLKIMDHYFMRVVPVIERLDVPYWTEFVLTPGSKSLRRVLITELGMFVTGIRIHCYKAHSKADGRMMSCLVAHGKRSSVTSILEKLASSINSPEVVNFTNTLLGIVNEQKINYENLQNVKNIPGQAITLPICKESEIIDAINAGFSLVGIDPFDQKYSLYSFNRRVLSELRFLKNEKITEVDRLMEYVFRGY